MKWPGMRRSNRRGDPGRLRLWPIGWALGACFAAAVAGLGALTSFALALLHHPKIPRSSTVSLHDLVGILQLVFASVAGAGALVALVVAYRRQRVAEATSAHDRTRVLNERFTAIATQLGHDHAAVRLAGAHAMAGLADDWEENRQTCIDVLCAYLRLPYEPDPGEESAVAERLAFGASREVRQTVIRVITAHLRPNAAISWEGLNLDFTGVIFDGGDFSGAQFSGGQAAFSGARFSRGEVSFSGAGFSGATVDFSGAAFSGGTVDFSGAAFSGGTVDFSGSGFSGGEVSFRYTRFSGTEVDFSGAKFSRGEVSFLDAGFSGGKIDFNAEFSGALVSFSGARFSGATVDFSSAGFSRALVSFRGAVDWSHPPTFDGERPPASLVKLPVETGADLH